MKFNDQGVYITPEKVVYNHSLEIQNDNRKAVNCWMTQQNKMR